MKKAIFSILVLTSINACKMPDKTEAFGSIERIDPSINAIIDQDASTEILSEGYEWCEGPVWIASKKMLLFSDIPRNTIFQWSEEKGAVPYLKPAGYTGDGPSNSNEEGSNGLAVSTDGQLLLCQHGDRRIAVMEAPLDAPEPVFTTLAGHYGGKKFNSPNDLALRKNGDLFFTDPPYGLPKNATPEIPFHGVYQLSGSTLTLRIDSLTRPNGIAFMPGEKTIIIANSDRKKALWYAYDLDENGALTQGRIFHDAREALKTDRGLPDGLKIDRRGNVFASGPGGIWIFNRDGKLLGKLKIPARTANCAFGDDEKTLYITADNYLLRIRLRR